MVKIKSDLSALENLVYEFLVAAKSNTLRAACDIFYVHANDLTVGTPQQNLMLAGRHGLVRRHEGEPNGRGRPPRKETTDGTARSLAGSLCPHGVLPAFSRDASS